MSCFIAARRFCVLAAVATLLYAAPAIAQSDTAQSDIGFIEAPLPTEDDNSGPSLRVAQAPEALPPEALDDSEPTPIDAEPVPIADAAADDIEMDYSFDAPMTQKGDCCGNECDDCCECDACCRRGCDLFGCLRRMMETCADHKRARCAGCYDTCADGRCKKRGGCLRMNCEKGQRHNPNRTPAATGELFRQYYAQPRCGNGVAAQMHVAPYPVPAHVGHTYITYQAFEPSQFMYRHKRKYTRNHGPSGGKTTTRIYWW